MRSKIVQRILDRTPEDVKIFSRICADIVVLVNTILEEKGITQKTLAERMEKRPSEISKWLSGEHNFTLRSLAKLQAELGEPILEVPIKNKLAAPAAIEGKASFTVTRSAQETKITSADYKTSVKTEKSKIDFKLVS